MKKLVLLFTVLTVLSCNEKISEPIIGLQFKDHREIDHLSSFNKVSDTTLFHSGSEPGFSLLHLNNGKKELVLFSRIWNDSEHKRNYEVLDTLSLTDLDEREKITIGYCEMDLKDQNSGNIIARVDKVDSKKMLIGNIKHAWVANPDSGKIEALETVDNVDCINQWYHGEETKIDYGLLFKK